MKKLKKKTSRKKYIKKKKQEHGKTETKQIGKKQSEKTFHNRGSPPTPRYSIRK